MLWFSVYPRLNSQLGGPSKILNFLIMKLPLIKHKVLIMFLIEFCIGWAIKLTFANSNHCRPFWRAPDIIVTDLPWCLSQNKQEKPISILSERYYQRGAVCLGTWHEVDRNNRFSAPFAELFCRSHYPRILLFGLLERPWFLF